MMRAGEWARAIRFASKFPRLGEHKEAIMRAASALLSPELYRQMGRDPAQLVAAGVDALKSRYPKHLD